MNGENKRKQLQDDLAYRAINSSVNSNDLHSPTSKVVFTYLSVAFWKFADRRKRTAISDNVVKASQIVTNV